MADVPLPAEFDKDNEANIYEGITTDPDEKSVLQLPPKYAVYNKRLLTIHVELVYHSFRQVFYGEMWVDVRLMLICLHTCLCVDFTYYIMDDSRPGTYLGNVGADTHLMDSLPPEEHSLIRFSQLQKDRTDNSQLFNVSKTGEIYTAQTLDAESLCKYNIECYKMVDIAVRRRKSFLKILEIKVIIEDINDHQPEFPETQINLTFSETDGRGTTRSIPNAVDKDVGIQNSQINYELIKNDDDPFTLSVFKRVDGTSYLRLSLEKKLDRELKDNYLIKVLARNGRSPLMNGILKVNISVTDVNDNLPVFTHNIYNVSVSSNHQQQVPVVTVSAKDLDSGENGNISFYFSSKTSDIARSNFQIDKNSGKIFLSVEFKPERKQIYKLFIEARDNGNPPLSSVVPVVVNVINKQNNAPMIDVNFSELTGNTGIIFESMEVGSFIAYVKVVDNDRGPNGEVACNIDHDKLQLQSLSHNRYKVVVKMSVDREKETHINLTIVCEDKGYPPLKTERNFSIQVMDVNDVRPYFTKDTFKFLTYENEKPNFPVGFINAKDPDLGSGGQLTFSLIGNGQNVLPFEISNFGFISTIASLDREQNEVYKFGVFVKDNGIPPLNNTANIIVEVMDENDNAPYFTFPSVNPFSFDVYYNPQSKNDIIALRASDRDSRQNAFLKYEIIEGNEKQLFSVNLYTGVLTFSRPVYQNDAGVYDISVSVKDSGTPVLSARTTLSLTLTVSNSTSRMFSVVDTEPDTKIPINLFVAIIVAAVTVSVLLVVSITVCIVRRNNHRNTRNTCVAETSKQMMDKNRQSEYFCAKQLSCKYDDPDVIPDTKKHKSSQKKWQRGNSSKQESSQNSRQSTLDIHCQTLTRGIHQESNDASQWKERDSAVLFPYRYCGVSTIPCNSKLDCNKEDKQHLKDQADYKAYQKERVVKVDSKSLPHMVNRPKEGGMNARYACPVAIGQNSLLTFQH
ncbi:protocadherin beta-15 isoform X2 [Octopus bimaculoides]|uniref:protocadherin beta-15 isoform X2 n=1 Tax=Octopus bimaculoides TaxID=37653 RepID=UPI0022E621FA|nr:protocadherin beta-15 isoform X2 [Octopus bimaculoides]